MNGAEIILLLIKDAFENMLVMFREKRDSLASEFEGALIERHRPLLDELERDIKISLSRIAKHMRDNDWSQIKCDCILKELRERNVECEKKVKMLAKIFPYKRPTP